MLVNSKNDQLYRTEDEDVRWPGAGHPPTDGASMDIILDSSDADSRSTCDNDPPSPPPGCSSSDGEWVWMTNEDWILLEEFTETAKCASDMMRTQRDVIEGKGKEGDHKGQRESESEKALLQEMKRMRLQIAELMEEKTRIEQDNAALVKNCHFLHNHNKELKQKKMTNKPRLFAAPLRKSSLSVMSNTVDEHIHVILRHGC